MIVDVAAAEAELSHFIDRACMGEEVIISVDTKPMVSLVPIRQKTPRRVFGSMKGKFTVPSEFFEPLPMDESEAWDQ
jgi:antitoxin (DNA-binding transcriptional repressor) of toxin-antitoxin stability system